MPASSDDNVKKSKLKIYYCNPGGTRSKLSQLYAALAANEDEYDAVVIVESWLNASIISSEFTPPGWTAFRRDRCASGDTRNGGGVMILARNHLKPSDVLLNDSDIEQIWVKLRPFDNAIYIGAVYIPPNPDADQMQMVVNSYQQIEQMMNDRDETFLCCDLNLPRLKWMADDDIPNIYRPIGATTDAELVLCDGLLAHNLFQLNNVVNVHGNTLDTVFASCHDQVLIRPPSNQLCSGFGWSNFHSPVELHYEMLTSRPHDTATDPGRNFKRANYQQISLDLSRVNWIEALNSSDVNTMVTNFYDILYSSINRNVPLKRGKKPGTRPWMSANLRRLRTQKRNLSRRVSKFNLPSDADRLAALHKRFEELNLHDYHNYVKAFADELKVNPKKFWNFINERRGVNQLPSTLSWNMSSADKDTDIANLLATYFASVYSDAVHDDRSCNFAPHATIDAQMNRNVTEDDVRKLIRSLDVHKGAGPDGIPPSFYVALADDLIQPLTILYNASLQSSIFPTEWKRSNVTPIYKNGSRSLASNYRPISILSCAGKMLDQLVSDRISILFEDILTGPQHAYKKGLSTVTNLMEYVSGILNHMESGKQVDSIYLDFAKAFDSINHHTLVTKLSLYGLDDGTCSWFSSYLSERTQRVRVRNAFSQPYDNASGVPQGSHLGPVLFIIYMEDLLQSLTSIGCSAYADDIKIFKAVQNDEDRAQLQDMLSLIQNWGVANGLLLNASKCNVITFSRKRDSICHNYHLADTELKRVNEVIDLGVLLNSGVNLNAHVDFVSSKAMSILGLVKRFGKALQDFEAIRLLYCSLVRSKLEYAAIVWSPYHRTYQDKLESVQKKFIQFLMPSMRDPTTFALPPYTDRLACARLQPLWARRMTSSATFIFDLLFGTIRCKALKDQVIVNEPGRTRTHDYIRVPYHRTDYGRFNPINRCRMLFNKTADFFLEGHSRRWYRASCDHRFTMTGPLLRTN